MNRKNSLGLLAAALALTAANVLLFLLTPKAPPPPGRLVATNPKDVSSYELWDGDRLVATLAEDAQGEWSLKSETVADAADPDAVLELQSFIVRAYENPLEVKPAEVGLGDLIRARQFVAKTANGNFSLFLGGLSPDGKRRYVMRGGDHIVHGVDAELARFADRDTAGLRSRDLFSLKMGAPLKIAIRTGKGTVCMEASEKGWVLSEPVVWPVDPQVLERLLGLLAGLRAQSIEADQVGDAKLLGLGDDAPSVTVTMEKGEETVRLGSRLPANESACFALRQGRETVYAVSTGLAQFIATSDVADYRRRELGLLEDGNRVSLLQLASASEGTVKFQVRDGKWVVSGARTFDVETDAVNNLIQALQALRVLRFVSETRSDLAKYGLDRPAMKIGLYAPDGQQLTGVTLSPVEEGGLCYAMAEGRSQIVAVDGNVGHILQRPFVQYRDRTVAAFDLKAAQTVTMLFPEGRVAYLHNGGYNWQQSFPQTAPVSKDAIPFLNLLRRLSALKCLDYVAENSSSDGQFGLDRPRVRVVVTLRSLEGDPATGLDLEIGSRIELSLGEGKTRTCVYARRYGEKAVFLLDAKLAEDALRVYK